MRLGGTSIFCTFKPSVFGCLDARKWNSLTSDMVETASNDPSDDRLTDAMFSSPCYRRC